MHGCEQNLLQNLLQNVPLLPAASWQLGSAPSGAQQGLQNAPLLPAAAWQLGSAPSGAQQVQMSLGTARACAGVGCGVAATCVCRAQQRLRVACLSPVCAGSAAGFAGAGVCRPAAAASSRCERGRWSF